jgi:hypothetical protein
MDVHSSVFGCCIECIRYAIVMLYSCGRMRELLRLVLRKYYVVLLYAVELYSSHNTSMWLTIISWYTVGCVYANVLG